MTDLTQQQREALEAVCKLEAWAETRVGAGNADAWASAARTYILNSTQRGEGYYTQGVCDDGAAILCDGQPLTVDEVVSRLNHANRPKPAPEGWQLVPVKPSAEMVRAGLEGYAQGVENIGGVIPIMSSCATGRAYRAMLAAAPAPEDSHD